MTANADDQFSFFYLLVIDNTPLVMKTPSSEIINQSIILTGYDALGRDAEAAIVEDDGAQSVESFHVDARVSLDTLQVVGGGAVSGSVATKLLVVVLMWIE